MYAGFINRLTSSQSAGQITIRYSYDKLILHNVWGDKVLRLQIAQRKIAGIEGNVEAEGYGVVFSQRG